MKRPKDYDNRTWARLFDFAFSDEEMSREQVEAELRRLGIDMRPALSNVRALLERSRETRQAKEGLENAKKQRRSLMIRVLGIEIPPLPQMRETLEQLIRQKLSGPTQAAYFRKLESAASDEDLKSLLEDIERLEAFWKEENDAP